MARKLRVHRSAAVYHVMLRGNNKQPIFFSEEDKCKMCLLLQEGVEKFDHQILAFCFMNNHVHFAIQVGAFSISQVMHHLAAQYSVYVNKKYERVGHLFQGRFTSILVDESRYLRELIRYIHLNPVRAKLVSDPKDFIWSSHRCYLQLEECTWLNKKYGLEAIEFLIEYDKYILLGMERDKAKVYLKNYETENGFLKTNGIDNFVEIICNKFNISTTSLCSKENNHLLSHARALLMLLARERCNISLNEISEFLCRSRSGLHKSAKRFMETSALFRTDLEELLSKK